MKKKKAQKVKHKTQVKKPVVRKGENTFGIIPLNDRVVVKPLDMQSETQTASGIIIPDTVSKEKPEQGTVVAIGKKVEGDLKIGDKIVFSRYGFEDIKVKGVEYYILKEENVLAVIK